MIYNFLLISILSIAPLQQEWHAYVNNDGGFSILVPGGIKVQEKIIATGTGDVLLTTCYSHTNVDSTDNFLYVINYYPIDNNTFSKDSIDFNWDYLHNSVIDIIETTDGELLYSNKESIRDFPVLTYRSSYQEKENHIKGKVILTEDMFFSLQVFTTKNYTLNKNMDKFLNSFRLL